MTGEALLSGHVFVWAGECWLHFRDPDGSTHRIATNLPAAHIKDAKRWLTQIQVAATTMRETPWKAVVA